VTLFIIYALQIQSCRNSYNAEQLRLVIGEVHADAWTRRGGVIRQHTARIIRFHITSVLSRSRYLRWCSFFRPSSHLQYTAWEFSSCVWECEWRSTHTVQNFGAPVKCMELRIRTLATCAAAGTLASFHVLYPYSWSYCRYEGHFGSVGDTKTTSPNSACRALTLDPRHVVSFQALLL
jgi:hypothetical protein